MLYQVFVCQSGLEPRTLTQMLAPINQPSISTGWSRQVWGAECLFRPVAGQGSARSLADLVK